MYSSYICIWLADPFRLSQFLPSAHAPNLKIQTHNFHTKCHRFQRYAGVMAFHQKCLCSTLCEPNLLLLVDQNEHGGARQFLPSLTGNIHPQYYLARLCDLLTLIEHCCVLTECGRQHKGYDSFFLQRRGGATWWRRGRPTPTISTDPLYPTDFHRVRPRLNFNKKPADPGGILFWLRPCSRVILEHQWASYGRSIGTTWISTRIK